MCIRDSLNAHKHLYGILNGGLVDGHRLEPALQGRIFFNMFAVLVEGCLLYTSSQTALENVSMPLMFRGVDKRTREKLALQMLHRVGLGERCKPVSYTHLDVYKRQG